MVEWHLIWKTLSGRHLVVARSPWILSRAAQPEILFPYIISQRVSHLKSNNGKSRAHVRVYVSTRACVRFRVLSTSCFQSDSTKGWPGQQAGLRWGKIPFFNNRSPGHDTLYIWTVRRLRRFLFINSPRALSIIYYHSTYVRESVNAFQINIYVFVYVCVSLF
jgi:hypothetical protein